MSNETYPIYEAQIGALGSVTFFKEPETGTHCFMFHNGMDYTPIYLSEEAAYYVWAFIGCEHPDCLNVSAIKTKSSTCSPATKKKKKPVRKKAKAR